MYHVGRTEEDRENADKTFLKNMTLVIDNKTRWGFMKRLRMKAAQTFYYGVQRYGSSFFATTKGLLKELYVT